jgi:hypothetical protein
MGRRALPADELRKPHGYNLAPITVERVDAITDKTGEKKGALIDRLVAAEYIAIVTSRRKRCP